MTPLLIFAGILILAFSMPALLEFFIQELRDWLMGFRI